jgi:hypothetical protein
MRNASEGRRSSTIKVIFERIRLSGTAPIRHQIGSRHVWIVGLSSPRCGGLIVFGVLNLIAHLISAFHR